MFTQHHAQQIGGLQGQPCTGNDNRRMPYCYQIRFILLLWIVMLLNKYVSFRQHDMIYGVIFSPSTLGLRLRDGTCHLANDTGIYVKRPHMPSVHLPASGGLAAESQRECCLVTATMDATLCQGLGCNGFKLNCWVWSWERQRGKAEEEGDRSRGRRKQTEIV